MRSKRESGVHELSGARRVLIVDDQQDAAELTAMVLADAGHEVQIAYDAESALALALEFRPQVALLDIGLPTMNGLELASAMRATPKLAKCQLIAMTGQAGPSAYARSMAAGFDRHVTKPFPIEALLAMLDSAVHVRAESA